MKPMAAIAVVTIIFMLSFSCTRWKWHECRKVGHGVIYCINEVAK